MEGSAVILAITGAILILGGPLAGYFVFRYRYGKRLELADTRERQLKSRELKLDRSRRPPPGSPFEGSESEAEDTISMLKEDVEQKSLELSIVRQDYELEIRVLKEEASGLRNDIARLRGEPVEVQDIVDTPISDLHGAPSARGEQPASSESPIEKTDLPPVVRVPEKPPTPTSFEASPSYPGGDSIDDTQQEEERPAPASTRESQPEEAPESETMEYWVMSDDSSGISAGIVDENQPDETEKEEVTDLEDDMPEAFDDDVPEENTLDLRDDEVDIYDYLFPEEATHANPEAEAVEPESESVSESEDAACEAAPVDLNDRPDEDNTLETERKEQRPNEGSASQDSPRQDSGTNDEEELDSRPKTEKEASPARPDRPPKSFEPKSPEEAVERVKSPVPFPAFTPVSDLMQSQDDPPVEAATLQQIVQLPDEQYQLLTELGYASLDKIACLSSSEVRRLSDIFNLPSTVIESDWIPNAQLKLFERDK